MRIDREGFLAAAASLAAALAGCERAEPEVAQLAPPKVEAPVARPKQVTPPAPKPAVAVATPIDPVVIAPKPKPVGRPLSASKRWFLGLSVQQKSNVTALCAYRAENPCAGLLARMVPRPVRDADEPLPIRDDVDEPTPPAENPEEKYLAGLSGPQRQQAASYCVEKSGMPAPTCETPLVVAFENQPIDFLASTGEQFAFAPGVPMTTAWPTAATPWIARDLDGDGEITSGTELFGSSTALPGGATARNGFEALAGLDANADGVIDRRDPGFAELVLWSDRNGDHRSTRDELRPLSSVVTSIPLAHSLDVRCTERDDCEGERGTLRWRDAANVEHGGAVVDIYLRRR